MSAQAEPITATEMRYVRTLRGLSPVHVNLVTREMGKGVKVIIKHSNVLN